ncbi:predicted protein [Naegleria gruberi]|uniref:Predicted protein n=1 Tax=Naegleria gruberi TaxID=5762 RepID=D2VVN8_NAEGR|nr:uncharacterized protein NAEGRDRAFT_73085 [Naegleria gruberi]EFC39073.1 predicted protein [Naegleria gruberi]|eukprot:XP_002671817.1 predicted protein [Naegleria gruberi strain NEG-M]
MEKIIEIKGAVISSPIFDTQGGLCFSSINTGDVYLVPQGGESDQTIHLTNTKGSPTGVAFNYVDGSILVADSANQAILKVNPENNNQVQIIRGDFRGKPFIGPNNVIVDSKGMMYFSDSGPLGETSIENPKGSVYCLSTDGKILKSLAYECLAYPSGLAFSPHSEDVIYVAETMKNRILRFTHINGAFYCSVFQQLSGGFGPTGICVDDEGNIYVAMYEFKQVSTEGRILVLSEAGVLKKEIILENISEITGITYKRGFLYITEGNSVYKYELD